MPLPDLSLLASTAKKRALGPGHTCWLGSPLLVGSSQQIELYMIPKSKRTSNVTTRPPAQWKSYIKARLQGSSILSFSSPPSPREKRWHSPLPFNFSSRLPWRQHTQTTSDYIATLTARRAGRKKKPHCSALAYEA